MERSRCVALAVALLWGAPGGARGAEPESLTVDLDGDGTAERIDWVKFGETEDEGDFYQVRVTSHDGRLLWEGPRVKDTGNPLVYGDWHFGYSLPELAADIDGDGSVEMVAPAPQSDVSPTYFRVVRWRGGRFVPVRSGALLESPNRSEQFPWSETEEYQGTWISSFLEVDQDGAIRVEVFEYWGGEDARIGEALVTPVAGGYEVHSWLRVMTSTREEAANDPGEASPEESRKVAHH